MGSWAGCTGSREGMAGPLGRGPGLWREGRSGKVRGGETGKVACSCSGLLCSCPRDVGSGEFLKIIPIVEMWVLCVLREQEVWVLKEKSCKT